mgnify:FL=1
MQEESALVSRRPDAPIEARKTKDSTMDRIWKYYHDKKRQQNLTEEEKKIRDRWEKAWYFLCQHRNLKDTAALLEKMFDIKKSVAYDDARNAMMLFGDPRTNMKDAKRAIAETMVLRGADKAWKKGDLEAYYKFTKQYTELNQLNVEDDGRIAEMIKKLRPVQITFVTSKEQLKKQADELMKGIPAVDVEFEELDEAEAEN